MEMIMKGNGPQEIMDCVVNGSACGLEASCTCFVAIYCECNCIIANLF